MNNPCQSCGACCATFRVSFHRSQLDSEVGGYVPETLADEETQSTCRMRGTDRSSRIEAAITNDGRVHGIRMNIRENVGAYLRAPEPSCVILIAPRRRHGASTMERRLAFVWLSSVRSLMRNSSI